jgi:heat shock protein HslJ
MNTKVKTFILTTLLFAMQCNAGAQVPPGTDNKINKSQSISALAGKWYLEHDVDSDSSFHRLPEIDFDIVQYHFSGSTGCNRMSGSFTATEKSLHISNKMITTRMFCPGYDEMSFLKNLLKVDGYHFNNDSLIMTCKDSVVSSWIQKMPSPKKPD